MNTAWLKKRQTKYSAYAATYILVIVAVLGAINFLANRYSKAYDSTANKQFSLSDQTVKVVGNLKKLPKEWVNEDGVSLNFQFFRYATPLIQGEIAVPYDNGLPAYARLSKEGVDKTLSGYEA